MPEDIATEVISIDDHPEGKEVVIETTKMSPVPTEFLVRERARMRALVAVGIASSVADVVSRLRKDIDLERMTRVTSFRTVKKEGMALNRQRWTVVVRN